MSLCIAMVQCGEGGLQQGGDMAGPVSPSTAGARVTHSPATRGLWSPGGVTGDPTLMTSLLCTEAHFYMNI